MIKKNQKINKILNFSLLFIVAFYFSLQKQNLATAQNNNINSEVIELISRIDRASSNKDLETLNQYISPQFSSEDGLDNQTFLSTLESLWNSYTNLTYTTNINSTEENQGQLIINTTTIIEGSKQENGETVNLLSEITARQTIENQQLVGQEILTEKTRITTGANPPDITFRLPESARAGQVFDLDAIVEDPIGNGLILGGIKEERVNASLFTNPQPIELDALSAGGIFKRVTISEGDHWYSAIFIRDDGTTMITQRVRVE
ncbi:nuclear transport factor 2 family protein [Cyanobacterium stanieri LEGE 03274]|uniref:Nuclear transport factor 2 family protein n=1 Tax=Cyanobacterium stanieri LEGE 03274 TaxID=1828756 RepID=A0ABR9V3K3_9CHRO|nr:nuclear transport factor 2 family protein [Cyanobacterium stanieri]MBE9222479.1 nuclear transport factor 2 family protein [Cyanobacterium stanieri LEGE 03274]